MSILKYMIKYSGELDLVFQALCDPTRRVMVERLTVGPASVSELAKPLPMSLPAVYQHLQVLEASGLVTSVKVGRVRTCHLEPTMLNTAEAWIGQRRRTWEKRLERLDTYLASLPEEASPPEENPDLSVSKKGKQE
jgi:DNA-binding transcriptional ArsR family regulator